MYCDCVAIEPPPDPVTSVSCPSIHWSPWSCMRKIFDHLDHHHHLCQIYYVSNSFFLLKFHKNVKNLQNEKALDLHTLIPVHDHLQTYRLNSGLLTNLILISSCSTRSILILKSAQICSALTCKTKKWWLYANLQPSWQTANLGTNYVPLQKNTFHVDCQHWKLVLS